MCLLRQNKSITVRNIDEGGHGENKHPRHSTLLPNKIRALIVGPFNCGKTNVMISHIESPNGLKF